MRKLNARADRIFLVDVAFFYLGEHKNFRPVALLPKMEIANPPLNSASLQNTVQKKRIIDYWGERGSQSLFSKGGEGLKGFWVRGYTASRLF